MPCLPLVGKAAFEGLLRQAPLAKSQHFALHYVPAPLLGAPQLSTTQGIVGVEAVDKSQISVDKPRAGAPAALPLGQTSPSLGLIVPKRHAKRAVTRNLLRRCIRARLPALMHHWPAGNWLVRLRQGFAAEAFTSASSSALRQAVMLELSQLLAKAHRAAAPEQGRGKPARVGHGRL